MFYNFLQPAFFSPCVTEVEVIRDAILTVLDNELGEQLRLWHGGPLGGRGASGFQA